MPLTRAIAVVTACASSKVNFFIASIDVMCSRCCRCGVKWRAISRTKLDKKKSESCSPPHNSNSQKRQKSSIDGKTTKNDDHRTAAADETM